MERARGRIARRPGSRGNRVKIHSSRHEGKIGRAARSPPLRLPPAAATDVPLAAGIAGEIRRRRAEPRLTVAVDVNSFYEELTGVGWYLHQILAHLADARRPAAAPLRPEPADPPRRTPARRGRPWRFPPARRSSGSSTRRRTAWSSPPGGRSQILRRLAPLLAAADGNRVLFAPNYLFPPALPLRPAARGWRRSTISGCSRSPGRCARMPPPPCASGWSGRSSRRTSCSPRARRCGGS